MAYDLIIKGGTVVDGSGLPGYAADVAISDGRIAAIGESNGATATEVIDGVGHDLGAGADGETFDNALAGLVAQVSSPTVATDSTGTDDSASGSNGS